MNCKAFLFASLLVFVAVYSSSLTAAQNISTTDVPKNATTTPVPVTNTTTPAKNTTTPAPATNTTTPAPAKNTTQTPSTTPTTTLVTTTMPVEPKNNYTVKDGNVTCIKMQAEILFSITYEQSTKDGKMNATAKIALPKDFKTSGSCAVTNGTQKMIITFFKDWTLEYDFYQDAKANSGSYYVSGVNLKYTLDGHFVNATDAGKSKTVAIKPKKDYMKATSDGYYLCKDKLPLKGENVEIDTSDLKYAAFNTKGDIDFSSGSVSECSTDEDTNSIVPIAVGAALAGLVVIVLIAYLIGRKRTRKTGYESV